MKLFFTIIHANRFYLFCLFFLISVQFSYAQRAVERSFILNPLENSQVELQEGEKKWFTQMGGWGSFGNYLFSGDEDHAWQQQLGVYAEIYRWGNRSSLALTGHVEIIADKRNDIYFSPRAVIWEEGFLYTHRVGSSFLQAGYYHRCKHDVDNWLLFEERITVFGSAFARLIVPVQLFSEGESLLSIQYDHYTITGEKRTPDPSFGKIKNWGDLINSLQVSTHTMMPLGSSSNFYMDGYLMGVYLKDEFRMNGMIRMEIGRETPAGQIRFGIHTEYLADNGISVSAKSVTLAGIGIRLMPAGVFR